MRAHRACFSIRQQHVCSDDDWYTTSAGLVVTETTINNNNNSLWSYVVPHTVPDWVRNNVANRLATSGATWSEIFQIANSGTYNNMFSILDYKLFTPGTPLQDNLLYVFEQMPGPNIAYGDFTGFLRAGNQSYWASYNRIATPWLFNITNQWGLVQKYGQHFSYANTSRANIFRRDQGTVVDEASFRRLMRYNNFESDPLSFEVRVSPLCMHVVRAFRCILHGVHAYTVCWICRAVPMAAGAHPMRSRRGVILPHRMLSVLAISLTRMRGRWTSSTQRIHVAKICPLA
jgi:hypothetical protein